MWRRRRWWLPPTAPCRPRDSCRATPSPHQAAIFQILTPFGPLSLQSKPIRWRKFKFDTQPFLSAHSESQSNILLARSSEREDTVYGTKGKFTPRSDSKFSSLNLTRVELPLGNFSRKTSKKHKNRRASKLVRVKKESESCPDNGFPFDQFTSICRSLSIHHKSESFN